MTFELLDIKITVQNGKQPSKVEVPDVHCCLARVIESRLGMTARRNYVFPESPECVIGWMTSTGKILF